MSFNDEAISLISELQVAHALEGVATIELHEYLKSGGSDTQTLEKLTKRMTKTHNDKMLIYSRLQPHLHR